MALQQIIQHSTGAYSQYWRVVRTDLNYESTTAEVEMYGYVSEEARQQGKSKLDTRTFAIEGSDFSTYFTPVAIDPENINQVKNSYLYIKGISGGEFASALDV